MVDHNQLGDLDEVCEQIAERGYGLISLNENNNPLEPNIKWMAQARSPETLAVFVGHGSTKLKAATMILSMLLDYEQVRRKNLQSRSPDASQYDGQ